MTMAPVPDLDGRRCFITGAASGIGRATAIAAARKGADLYLTDIAAEGLDRVAAEIAAGGGRVSWRRVADVADRDAVVAMANEIHGAYGAMDVVMNIAGVSTWGTVSELRHEDWRQMVEVNLMAPISVLESFVPPMIAAGCGSAAVWRSISSVSSTEWRPVAAATLTSLSTFQPAASDR